MEGERGGSVKMAAGGKGDGDLGLIVHALGYTMWKREKDYNKDGSPSTSSAPVPAGGRSPSPAQRRKDVAAEMAHLHRQSKLRADGNGELFPSLLATRF